MSNDQARTAKVLPLGLPSAGWSSWSLSTRFIIAAAMVLCVSMAALGSWVNRQITRSVLATSGATAASFMDDFIEPLIQDIRADGTLSPESRTRLDAMLTAGAIRRSFVSIKLWRPDGMVIYSSETKDLEGKTFNSTDVRYAASGLIKAEFADMKSAESSHEQTLGVPLIEVYAPLYNLETSQVIAVGEVYENAVALARQLQSSRMQTWGFVFVTTILMLSILYLIVRRGSHTIAQQRSELQRRIGEVQKISSQNESLRRRAELTRLNANEANEELIGRVGQELHDGPIQTLSLVMLRIDKLFGSGRQEGGQSSDVATIRDLTVSVINELRVLSTGLVLPEIRNLPVAEAIRQAVDRHENLTGTTVETDFDEIPEAVPPALVICLYRITQESLSNAVRHAGGIGQRVAIKFADHEIRLEVSDRGKSAPISDAPPGSRLGLRGIRNRVESFGGTVEIRSAENGTTVSARLPLT